MSIYYSPISIIVPAIFVIISSIKILIFYVAGKMKPNKWIGYRTDKSLSNVIYWKFLNDEMLKVTLFLEGVNFCIQGIFMFLIFETMISKNIFDAVVVTSITLAFFNIIVSILWVNSIEKRLP
jgi:hypothetical protein